MPVWVPRRPGLIEGRENDLRGVLRGCGTRGGTRYPRRASMMMMGAGAPVDAFTPLALSPSLYFDSSIPLLNGTPPLDTDGAVSLVAASNQRLTCQFTTNLPNTAGGVAFWMYCNGAPNNYVRPVSLGAAINGVGIEFSFGGSGDANFFIITDGGTTTSASIGILSGTWYRCLFTWNGTTGYFYINDSLVGTCGSPSTTLSWLNVGLNAAVAGPFNGYIDELFCWNRYLPSTDVAEDWNGGAGYIYNTIPAGSSLLTGLVNAWGLYEQPGNDRVDAIGGVHLAETNGPIALVQGIAAGQAIYANDPINTQLDLSGNANNATQAVAANRAILQLAAINGLNALSYNSTSAYAQLTNAVACTGPFTAYAVGFLGTALGKAWYPLYTTSASVNNGLSLLNGAVSGVKVYANINNVSQSQTYTGATNANIACRWRRDASNNVWFRGGGMSEIMIANMSGTMTVNCLGAAPGFAAFNGLGNLYSMQLLNNTTDLATVSPGLDAAFSAYTLNRWGVTW